MIVKIIFRGGISIMDDVLNFANEGKIVIIFKDKESIDINTSGVNAYTVYTNTGSVIEDTELVL